MVSRIIVNFAVFVVAFNPGHYSEKGNEGETLTFPGNAFLSYFFVKKYLLVCVSDMLWTGQWLTE